MKNGEGLYRVTRVVWYIFYFIEVVLALRFALLLLGANAAAAFTKIIYEVSGVFVAPFRYVFGSPDIGNSVFDFSTLLAMFVYWIAAWGIVKLLVMNRDVDRSEIQNSLESQDNA